MDIIVANHSIKGAPKIKQNCNLEHNFFQLATSSLSSS